MKRPGLTEAMRRKLLLVAQGQNILQRDWNALCEQGFAAMQCGFRMLTPRGFAALAAPRVTAAELAMLERLESWEGTIHGRDVTIAKSLRKKGLALCGFGSSGYRRAKITPAGTTALNNIRAASGSLDYKEN